MASFCKPLRTPRSCTSFTYTGDTCHHRHSHALPYRRPRRKYSRTLTARFMYQSSHESSLPVCLALTSLTARLCLRANAIRIRSILQSFSAPSGPSRAARIGLRAPQGSNKAVHAHTGGTHDVRRIRSSDRHVAHPKPFGHVQGAPHTHRPSSRTVCCIAIVSSPIRSGLE